jgi:cell division septal protein FtsQ
VAATRKSRARPRAAVVPLAGARSRVSLPQLPLPSAASVAAGLCLLALGLGGYAAARETAAFSLREIHVEGAPPGLAQEVREALGPLVGESLLALDGTRVRERVEAIPHVRSAAFDRAFPHALAVTVERELPVAVLRRGPGSWLVSDRGRVLETVGRGAHPRLPRVWVPKDTAVEPGAIVPTRGAIRGVAIAAALPASELQAHVRAIEAGERELALRLGSGLQLRLGDETELELKLAVAARLLPLLESPAAGGHEYLDVSVPERPVGGRNPQVEGER